MKLPWKLDDWQKEILVADGNICVNSGRQAGKSQIIAIKVGEYLKANPKKQVLIISVTEDQAQTMLQKIMLYLYDNYSNDILKKGLKKPTKHRVYMKNGAGAMTKAVGQYGIGILGGTWDIIVADECAYLPEAIWPSVTPMILTTGGHFWLLSTPNAMTGFFYKAYTDRDMGFKTFHVNSEDVAEARPEPQRTYMLNHLKREKARMTELQYAQQYLAQFMEEQNQLFPDALIHKCMTLKRPETINAAGVYYLGVDVARMGGDEITYEILEQRDDFLHHRENIIRKYQRTPKTIGKILKLEELYRFNRLYIDDGGLGGPVFDHLLTEPTTKRKVVAINNASRPLDRDAKRNKKLLKEDLYLNLLKLMELGKIKLLDDSEIFTSFKSIVIEHSDGRTKIYGRYSHIVEGLIRAAWCVRERRLKLYFHRQ